MPGGYPNPIRYPVFFWYPAQPNQLWKSSGCGWPKIPICRVNPNFRVLPDFSGIPQTRHDWVLGIGYGLPCSFFMFICLHYVQGFVQVFAKCCRVTALVVPCADNSHRQNLQEEGGSKSEAEHKGNDRETAKSRRQYVREQRKTNLSMEKDNHIMFTNCTRLGWRSETRIIDRGMS